MIIRSFIVLYQSGNYTIRWLYEYNGMKLPERKKVSEHEMRVLIFSTTFVWNISHSKKNWARYDHKCILVLMWSTGYSCHILMQLEFSWQIFEKILEYKISWKSVQWEPSCYMQKDGHRQKVIWRSYSRFSQSSERAHKNNSDNMKFKASTPTTDDEPFGRCTSTTETRRHYTEQFVWW